MSTEYLWASTSTNPLEEQQEEVIIMDDLDDPVNLIVHNDDVNTFDWVIESLMDICNHSREQAEQCAMIIHFKGRYCVKSGSRQKLKPMREALVDRGINATLEEND